MVIEYHMKTRYFYYKIQFVYSFAEEAQRAIYHFFMDNLHTELLIYIYI